MSRVLIAATLALAVACPKKRSVTRIDSPEAFTEVTLNAVVRELVPHVEQAAGAEFETIPFVRLGRPSDVDRILRAEAQMALSQLYPEAPEWLVDQMARSSGGAHISGKYAIEEKILLVSPDAMAATALQVDADDALDAVTRLVLAHELAHALQDQVAGTGERFDNSPHYDAFEALRAVTEGHANFVERRVSAALGLHAAQVALDASQGWSERGPDGAASWPIWALYGQGRTFVDWHFDQGGTEQAWQVVREPPQRSRTPFVPEEYGREAPVDEDLVATLADAEAPFGDGRWIAVSSPLVEKELRQRLFGMPALALEPWLASVEAGAYRQATKSVRSATFFRLRFADEATALASLDLIEAHRGAIATAASPGFGAEVDVAFDLEVAEVAGAQASRSFIRHAVRHVDGGPAIPIGASAEVHGLWVVVGRELLIVEASGFRPGVRLRRAAEAVIAR